MEIAIGEPVVVYQEMTIKNNGNKTINSTINLANYPTRVPEVYLDEYVSLAITLDGKIQSANQFVPVIVPPYTTKEYLIEYEFVPIYKEITCDEKTIEDLLPKDALILPSDVPPETVIEKTCNVKIHHEGDIHYYNVKVDLNEFSEDEIKSIYYVE